MQMNLWGGFSISLIGTTFPWYPHILATVAGIQKEHLLLHTPLLNKTPKLSSVRVFVRLYRLLFIHCIYVSVTKPTCPAFSAWLNTGSIRSFKVTEQAIMLSSMALPSKLCAALHSQSNVGPMCDCKTCRSLDSGQELRVTMVQVPEGTAVSSQGQHYA